MFRRPLVREISIVLAFKLLVLCALYVLFFWPDMRPTASADAVSRALLSAPARNQGE